MTKPDQPITKSPTANRQIARASVTVMASIVLGQVMGLLAKSLIGSAFPSSDLDAFYAANRFSETLYNLVAGGALSSAFIPVFTTCLENKQQSIAWKLTSSLVNLLLIILTGIGILAYIFAEPIVHYLLAPGFNAEQQVITARLLRLLLPTPVIFGMSGLAMGILNAHQSFLFPALAPSMYQIGLVLGVLLFKENLGIDGLCLGAVIGSGLHLLVQVPALYKLPGRKYELTLGLNQPTVREVFFLMLPRLLGVAVIQLNFWLNTYLASLQSEGSLMGINFAFTLMLMPEAAIAQAAAIAALPTFSAQVAKGKKDELRNSLAATLGGVLLLAIPATVGLILLRYPIIQLIYQRGEFTNASTEVVAWALLWYGIGLIGHCMVEITSRAFYALHDTNTPVFVGVVAMSLNFVFSLLFAAGFERIGWAPHGGLALANSLATGLEMAALLFAMRKKLGGLGGSKLIRSSLYGLIGSALMGACLILWNIITSNHSIFLVVFGGVAIGGFLYGLFLWAMKVPEVILIMEAVKTRFLIRFRKNIE